MGMFKIVASGLGFVVLGLVNLAVVYFLLSSPPIHFFYDVVPPAGPSSVYVPGKYNIIHVLVAFWRKESSWMHPTN
jgi:hypothetical protein